MPDTQSKYASLLAQAWMSHVDIEEKPHAVEGSTFRHSWAGSCSRQIGYKIFSTPVSNELSVADHWRFGLGTIVHERWQEILKEVWPGCEVELKVTIPEIDSSGHIDAVIRDAEESNPPFVTCLELKTIGGFGFKKSIGARGKAEGPRSSSIIQCALNAYAVDADEMVIVYLAVENLSPRELAKIGVEEWRRFAAEWTWSRDEFLPIALAEIDRWRQIKSLVDAGALPSRSIPDPELPPGSLVVDPLRGGWQLTEVMSSIDAPGQKGTFSKLIDAGTTWHCLYCPFQQRCAADLEAELA